MTDGFMPGQEVSATVGEEQIAGLFERAGLQQEGIMVESPAADAPYRRDVAFVRRLDTGEVEPFLYEHVSPR